jgi:hypothetical protein
LGWRWYNILHIIATKAARVESLLVLAVPLGHVSPSTIDGQCVTAVIDNSASPSSASQSGIIRPHDTSKGTCFRCDARVASSFFF